MPEHTPAPTPPRSLYGFFMYLFSKTLLGIYCVWAFVPDYYLHYFNIYYYPQKYWSTAVPVQCLVALTIFAFFIYPSINLILTPNIDSINTIQDPFSQNTILCNMDTDRSMRSNIDCICHDVNKCVKHSFKNLNEHAVPQLHDLNIRFVCKKLYLNKDN